MTQPAELQGLLDDLGRLGHAPRPAPPLGTPAAFDWVADVLLWLCQRAAPELGIAREPTATEQQRTAFLTSLGAAFFARTRTRLPLRRLYRAGGSAVRELRRLADTLLHAADGSTTAGAAAAALAAPARLPQDGAALRQLSQRLATAGAQLAGALAAGPAAAAAAEASLAATADVAALRARLEDELEEARRAAAGLEREVAALGEEAGVLEGRIERRHMELDRVERRLDALHAVKPAHSAQAAALEGELAGLHTAYLHQFRNLEYLEGQQAKLAAAAEAEAEEAQRQLRRIRRAAAAEEVRLLGGEGPAGAADHAARAQLGSDDSEGSEGLQEGAAGGLGGAPLGGWGLAALPRLPAGAAGAAGGAPLDLGLLPEDEAGEGLDGGAASPASPATGRSRLSMASDAQAEGRAVSFGTATTIPAHRPDGAGGGLGPRPPSARRTTGSGNALLRKAAAAGQGSADVLAVEAPAAAASLARRSLLDPASDSDF